MVAVPTLMALTRPAALTVATAVLLLLHVTFLLVALSGFTVAVSAGTAVITVTTVDGNHTATCTVTVTGGGGTPPALTASPALLEFDSSSDELPIAINSNIEWTVVRSATWLTVSPAEGNNSGTVNVTVQANTTGIERSATITVNAKSATGVTPVNITVNQSHTKVNSENIMPPSLTAYARDGVLHVSGLTPGATLQVYNVLGILVASPSPSEGGELVLPLPGKGVYIVTDGKNVVKVVNG